MREKKSVVETLSDLRRSGFIPGPPPPMPYLILLCLDEDPNVLMPLKKIRFFYTKEKQQEAENAYWEASPERNSVFLCRTFQVKKNESILDAFARDPQGEEVLKSGWETEFPFIVIHSETNSEKSCIEVFPGLLMTLVEEILHKRHGNTDTLFCIPILSSVEGPPRQIEDTFYEECFMGDNFPETTSLAML